MVDALRRARRWIVPPSGRVIDLRPAEVVPGIDVVLPDGGRLPIGGPRVDEERRERHRAADRALAEVLAGGELGVERESRFEFCYYAESAEELRRHLATTWRSTHLDGDAYERALTTLRSHPAGRLVMREAVGIRTLRARLGPAC